MLGILQFNEQITVLCFEYEVYRFHTVRRIVTIIELAALPPLGYRQPQISFRQDSHGSRPPTDRCTSRSNRLPMDCSIRFGLMLR